jgi:hypothetical protein
MSEKSSFVNPLSAAIGKATGVFTRPKLQRRALTAHAASELISAAQLSSVLLDLKENGIKTQDKEQPEEKTEISEEPLTVLSPRLTTWREDSAAIKVAGMAVDSSSRTERNTYEPRRNSDTAIPTQNNSKSLLMKDKNCRTSIHCLKVKEIITETLQAQLGNLEYNHRECGDKSRIISQIIEKRTKALNTSQYKVTVVVYIGALRDKGIELATQCVWSPGVDYFAMATYKNDTVFASGIVFATIFE